MRIGSMIALVLLFLFAALGCLGFLVSEYRTLRSRLEQVQQENQALQEHTTLLQAENAKLQEAYQIVSAAEVQLRAVNAALRQQVDELQSQVQTACNRGAPGLTEICSPAEQSEKLTEALTEDNGWQEIDFRSELVVPDNLETMLALSLGFLVLVTATSMSVFKFRTGNGRKPPPHSAEGGLDLACVIVRMSRQQLREFAEYRRQAHTNRRTAPGSSSD